MRGERLNLPSKHKSVVKSSRHRLISLHHCNILRSPICVSSASTWDDAALCSSQLFDKCDDELAKIKCLRAQIKTRPPLRKMS